MRGRRNDVDDDDDGYNVDDVDDKAADTLFKKVEDLRCFATIAGSLEKPESVDFPTLSILRSSIITTNKC